MPLTLPTSLPSSRSPVLSGQAVLQASRGRLPGSVYDRLAFAPAWAVDLLVATAIVVASWYVGKWVIRYGGRPVARRFDRPSVTRVVLQMGRAGIVAIAIILAAAIVGFSPGEILLSVTVFSAVLAVVMAPIVRRFIGGLFVLADQPYEIGDMVEIVDTGTQGFVEDVTLRYTKLFTLENTFMVIPNSEILERDIVNFSAEDERTRQALRFVVTYEGDLEAAREACVRAARGVDGVIEGGPPIRVGSTRYPAEPICHLDTLGDHGIELTLRYWVEKPYYLPRVRSEVQERLLAAFEGLRVDIAYPHAHLQFDDTSGALAVSVQDGSESMDASSSSDRT